MEVRGLADLNDSWESDFIQMNQTGPCTWEVPEPKKEDEKPAPEPHFFRVIVF